MPNLVFHESTETVENSSMKIPSAIKVKKGVSYQIVWQEIVREA
jgi:hypothetical protein